MRVRVEEFFFPFFLRLFFLENKNWLYNGRMAIDWCHSLKLFKNSLWPTFFYTRFSLFFMYLNFRGVWSIAKCNDYKISNFSCRWIVERWRNTRKKAWIEIKAFESNYLEKERETKKYLNFLSQLGWSTVGNTDKRIVIEQKEQIHA